MDTVSIVALSSLISIIVAILTTIRENRKDTHDSTEFIVGLREELKYIAKGTEEIKLNMRDINLNMTKMNERIIQSESRLDRLEKEVDIIKNMKEGK